MIVGFYYVAALSAVLMGVEICRSASGKCQQVTEIFIIIIYHTAIKLYDSFNVQVCDALSVAYYYNYYYYYYYY